MLERRSSRRVMLTLYAIATITTINEGALELLFPLNLDRAGYALPVVGTMFALLSLGSLLSRVPGGLWYRASAARRLIACCQAVLALSMLPLAFSDTWLVQSSMAVIHGVAFGLATTFMLALIADSQPLEQDATPVIAWYTAAISTGYAIGALLAALLIESFGYAGGFIVSGAAAVPAALLALTLPRREAAPSDATDGASIGGVVGRRHFRWLQAVPTGVWLATLLAFYINFVRDAYDTFFPMYAVSLGIPVTTVGFLKSIQSLSATGIRFTAAALFAVMSMRVVNHGAVITLALATVALSLFTNQWLLVAVFVALGVSRGLIRVTSAAAVAEERRRPGARMGLASGVYNAGLDAGAMLGPPLAGLLAATSDIPTTFRAVALALPTLYYAVWFTQRAHERRGVVREAT